MAEWQPIDLSESRATQLAVEKESRLEVYWTEFDTCVDEERRQMLRFLIRPLVSLTGDEEDDQFVAGLQIEGVDDEWRIVTTIRNHHLGLNPRITRFMATVSDDDKTVYVDVTKQKD